ncbi:MAG: serine/threonine protein kinase [Lachnospiraceae bacterium]|nr:serine/threonine protein kinase [Lachnospiraceae bacterium]
MYLCGKRYRVIGRLGEGSFGSVYLAEDTLLGNTWAIKEAGSSDGVSFAAIRAEINVLSHVSHPGIVRITDVFRSDDRIYLVMDHIKGMTLKEVIRSRIRIPEKTIFRWCMELCDAVSYLHNMDPPVILCDIKPQNIMVRPDGHIVLIDFGAALYESAKNDLSFASRKYAAPERLEGGAADVRSDIYALGKVIEEMTGRNKTFGIKAVIKRCTMKDPRFRYKSVKGVKRDIRLCHNAGRVIIIAAAAVIFGSVITANVRSNTGDIYEAEVKGQKAEPALEEGLMCLSEPGGYKEAEEYLNELPGEEYPEKAYYIRLCGILSEGGDDTAGLRAVLEEFQDFNEETVKREDSGRYAVNCFCINALWNMAEQADGRGEVMEKKT